MISDVHERANLHRTGAILHRIGLDFLHPDTGQLARLYPIALGMVTLVGFALPLTLLARYPFREDEAIYAYWALHAFRDDFFFLQVWPDKPPLFLWLLGGFMQLLGATDAVARLPNIFAHTLTIPVVAAIARSMWGMRTALYAALLFALHPFALSFAPTAYTDPFLVLLGMLSLCMVLWEKPIWAGFWLGCAIMTKQQGLLYVPLIGAALLIAPPSSLPATFARSVPARPWRAALRSLGALCVGALLVILPILAWDSTRWAVAPSPWDMATRNYVQIQLLPPHAWISRARQWAEIGWFFAASRMVWIALLLATVTCGVLGWRNRSRRQPPERKRRTSNRFITLLVLWAGGFALLHLITSLHAWDRYLLPLVPVWALLWGRVLSTLGKQLGRFASPLLLAAGLLLLGPPATRAAHGMLPVGGDHGAYSGLQGALSHLMQESGGDFVLYHQALGWHYQFYLYEQVRHGTADLRWFPHATYLMNNATKTPHKRKWLLVTDWAPIRDLAQRASMQRVDVVEHGRFGKFRLVELVPITPTTCDWCLCTPARPPFTYAPVYVR